MFPQVALGILGRHVAVPWSMPSGPSDSRATQTNPISEIARSKLPLSEFCSIRSPAAVSSCLRISPFSARMTRAFLQCVVAMVCTSISLSTPTGS